MADQADALRLVSRMFEAVDDGDRWPGVLDGLIQLTGSARGIMFVNDGPRIVWQHDANMGSEILSRLADFQAEDEWIKRRGLLPDSSAFLGTQLIAYDELRRTRYYHEFVGPAGCVHLGGISLGNGDRQFGAVSLFRPDHWEEFGRPELDMLEKLAPHVRRAAQLSARFADLRSQLDAARSALDELSVGLVLLDESRRILLQNAAAEALFRRGDRIRAAGGRLTAPDPGDAERLRHALALAGDGLSGTRRAAQIPLGDPLDGGVVVAAVVPLVETSSLVRFAGRARVAVLLKDGNRSARPPGALLRQAFGLTDRERELAEHLTQGGDLSSFAERNGLSINTVRPYLRAVFDKTGVNRQSELVRLMSALAI